MKLDTFHTPQDAVEFAIDFAVKAHDKQYRKAGRGKLKLPYITHILDVVRQICLFGVDDVVVWVAAVCHDIEEDTDYTSGTLTDMFGVEVSSVVTELSFRDRRSDESPQSYQKEKSAHLVDFVNASVEALVIKVADRLCNCRDYEFTDPKYALKYFHRADGLWTALEQRRDDVVGKYGEEAYETMQRHKETLLGRL